MRNNRQAWTPRLKEIDVQTACVDFMMLDGWRPLRTDPCSDRARGKGFGEEGMADHLFLRYQPDEILWVEFKRPAGRDAGGKKCAATKPSLHQVIWHQAERNRGARTAIASVDFEPTFEAFVQWYRRSGLLRREGL